MLPHQHPGSVLQRLRQVTQPNLFTSFQIRNRARQFKDAVIRPHREPQLVHRRLHWAAAGIVQIAVFAHLRRVHVGIALHGSIEQAEDDHRRHSLAGIHFDLDHNPIQSDHSAGKYTGQHENLSKLRHKSQKW